MGEQNIVIRSSGGLSDEDIESMDAEVKAEIEKAIADAKEVKDDDNLETVKAKVEALTAASLKIGQAIYGQEQQQGKDDAAAGEEKKEDDNTVDAEFKEKDEKDDKEKEEKK